MKLHLNWGRLVILKDAREDDMIYSVDLDRITDGVGVYIFGRRHGASFETLYVGKANNIRSRVKSQLNNLRLMQHMRNANAGKRFVLAGEIDTRPGQKVAKCLALVERALIRHFLSEENDLDEVVSEGQHPKRFFPKVVYLDQHG